MKSKKIFELSNDGKFVIDFEKFFMIRLNKFLKDFNIIEFLKLKKVKINSKEFFEKNNIYLDTGIITITAPNKEELKILVKRKGNGFGWKLTDGQLYPDTKNLLLSDNRSKKIIYILLNNIVKLYIENKIKPIMKQNIKKLEKELQN